MSATNIARKVDVTPNAIIKLLGSAVDKCTCYVRQLKLRNCVGIYLQPVDPILYAAQSEESCSFQVSRLQYLRSSQRWPLQQSLL